MYNPWTALYNQAVSSRSKAEAEEKLEIRRMYKEIKEMYKELAKQKSKSII